MKYQPLQRQEYTTKNVLLRNNMLCRSKKSYYKNLASCTPNKCLYLIQKVEKRNITCINESNKESGDNLKKNVNREIRRKEPKTGSIFARNVCKTLKLLILPGKMCYQI